MAASAIRTAAGAAAARSRHAPMGAGACSRIQIRSKDERAAVADVAANAARVESGRFVQRRETGARRRVRSAAECAQTFERGTARAQVGATGEQASRLVGQAVWLRWRQDAWHEQVKQKSIMVRDIKILAILAAQRTFE